MPQGREAGKYTSIEGELRPECASSGQARDSRPTDAGSFVRLENTQCFEHLQSVGMTQILTLAEQKPSWPWGAFARVAVLRQIGGSLLRRTYRQYSPGTLSTSRPLACLLSMSRLYLDKESHQQGADRLESSHPFSDL